MTDLRATPDAPAPGIFAMIGRDIITRPEHLGVKGFMLTASVPYHDVLSVKGLWAPPYASSDFALEVRLHGERVPTSDFLWNGNECRREGDLCGLKVTSALVVPMQQRTALLQVTMTSTLSEAVCVPVQMDIRGAVDLVSFWEFGGPGCSEANTPWAERANAWACEGDLVVKRKGAEGEQPRAVAVSTDLPMLRWETLCGHWEGQLALEAGQTRTFCIALTIGPAETAASEARSAVAAAPRVVRAAREDWAAQTEAIFDRLPHFEAADPRLQRFYERSLVGLLLNQWRVPEFVVSPYYSTGGINGGCVCCYLWDFGEPWEIIPLYDPEALKAHVRQFLSVDITHHFAWVPTTGEAFGPWYPVNQEKIIFLIYYYALLTGDLGFLQEQVAGTTVLEWVRYHACYRDRLDLPVALIDYGKGNNHLELRGTFRYDNYLPDLNLRRCANYVAAADLCAWAGEPAPEYVDRARELASLIKRTMWSPEHRWFHNLDENYQPQLSYNVQMFKPIAGPALDEEELEGLLSHLNEAEFLSRWGLHSMSKLDPAYDQVDIDNGGGGNYTAFTPQIIERLYKAGRSGPAEDVLARILWWGERMPYWGDSIVANQIEYRHDTPLQNTIGAVAGAQMVIFGLFGVQVAFDGGITVNPQPPSFCPEMALRGLRLRGKTLDIEVAGGQVTVTVDGETMSEPLGTELVVGA